MYRELMLEVACATAAQAARRFDIFVDAEGYESESVAPGLCH